MCVILTMIQTDGDFQARWEEHADNLVSTWEAVAHKLIAKMKTDIKDPECKKLVTELLTNEETSQQARS